MWQRWLLNSLPYTRLHVVNESFEIFIPLGKRGFSKEHSRIVFRLFIWMYFEVAGWIIFHLDFLGIVDSFELSVWTFFVLSASMFLPSFEKSDPFQLKDLFFLKRVIYSPLVKIFNVFPFAFSNIFLFCGREELRWWRSIMNFLSLACPDNQG